jgi:hypothetical protein
VVVSRTAKKPASKSLNHTRWRARSNAGRDAAGAGGAVVVADVARVRRARMSKMRNPEPM